MKQQNEIIKDILEKVKEHAAQIKDEKFFDFVIKVDEGQVKFVTVTLKKMY